MAKVEIISDKFDKENKQVILELSIPIDFLQEAIKHPENMKKAFAISFIEALDEFIIRKNIIIKPE